MSENTKVTKENTKGKIAISEKNLAIIITAAVLAVVAIASAIFLLVQAIKLDTGFDYLKSDLGKYIEFTEDYKNFTVNVDIAKPKDIDVDVAILKLLSSNKIGNGKERDLDFKRDWTIGVGDMVYIYYRGYIVGEDGEQIALDGMTNFGDASPYALEIGSGSFVPGFEYDMVDMLISDSNKFVKITSGNAKDGQIAYVSYTRTETDNKDGKTTATNLRIDLSDADIDAKYGENFKKTITETAIGTKVTLNTTVDGKSVSYTDLVVNFVTECEDKFLTVECYFPYSYGKTELRNETGYFEVYVNRFVDYDAPEFTEEFLKKQIEDKKVLVSEETLNTYEGETLVDKYYAYAKATLEESYETEYDALLREAILDYYREKAKVIKYPGGKVNEIYEDYYNKVNDSYIDNGGKITNSYGGSTSYTSLDTYAVAYLGLASNADWKAYLLGLAQDAVKERLILFYVTASEGIVPTGEEFAKELQATKDRIVDEYVQQYLDYEGKTAEDYDDYDAFVEERRADVFGYYTEEYFVESTYYELLMREATKWADVKTLDERRAYPFGENE